LSEQCDVLGIMIYGLFLIESICPTFIEEVGESSWPEGETVIKKFTDTILNFQRSDRVDRNHLPVVEDEDPVEEHYKVSPKLLFFQLLQAFGAYSRVLLSHGIPCILKPYWLVDENIVGLVNVVRLAVRLEMKSDQEGGEV